MNVSFSPLAKTHFSLLARWLEEHHVKKWWGSDREWTIMEVEKKYSTYVKQFKIIKLSDGKIIQKPIYPYIFSLDNINIGYIQYYDKHDFPPKEGYLTSKIPQNCAAIDLFIGENKYLNKNIGYQTLNLFIKQIIPKNFSHLFVDPEISNIAAIKCYQKLGFRILDKEKNIYLMLKDI